MKKYTIMVHVLTHMQVRKPKGIKEKKVPLAEIQVNGGTMAKKVDFGYNLFKKHVPVDALFSKD